MATIDNKSDKHARYHFDNDFTVNPQILGELLLYQLGEMLCDSISVIEPHVHLDWFEFTYVLSGSGTIYTSNVAQKVNEGDLYVSFPCEIHKLESDNLNPMRYCFFAFNFTNKAEMQPILNALLEFKDLHSRVLSAKHYESYFINALNYIDTLSAPLMDKLLEYELLTLITRVAHRAYSSNFEYHTPKINNSQLLAFNISNYIDANLISMENVLVLSEVFNYNYSYLSRCFKKCTQMSISQYFNDKKMDMAKMLLENNSLSITKIAQKLNYSSIYVFSRAFKNKYNISPLEYRNLILATKKNSNSPPENV